MDEARFDCDASFISFFFFFLWGVTIIKLTLNMDCIKLAS